MAERQGSKQKGPGPTRRGYEFGEVASALQKSIRRCKVDDALYWAVELDESGFGNYVWKRLRIMCSEDVGLACLTLPAQIRALYDNWVEQRKLKDTKHRPERLFLVHAVMLLANAPKSRMVDHALWYHYTDAPETRAIPDEALDKHTGRGRRKGRGWEHFFEEGERLENESNVPDVYAERARDAVQHAGQVPDERQASTQQEIDF